MGTEVNVQRKILRVKISNSARKPELYANRDTLRANDIRISDG